MLPLDMQMGMMGRVRMPRGADGPAPDPNEMIVNGRFDDASAWTVPSGWTIANGVATRSQAGGTILQQPITIVNGQHYTLKFDITANAGAGGMQAFFLKSGAWSSISPIYTAPGSYSVDVVVASGTVTAFGIQGTSNTPPPGTSIDNVSFIPVVGAMDPT